MRVSLDWLRDFVALDGDAERVADDLTSSGLEVESVERAGAPLDGVVVAEVLAVARHPNADRLSVCTVDDGRAEVQVVCGAPNVAAGIKAPFARVGTTLPGGKAIGAAELRGVELERHAVLGSGARAARRRRWPAAARRRRARRPPARRASAARRRDPRGERDAEPRRLLQRARHRARARGETRRRARAPRAEAGAGDARTSVSRSRCSPASIARVSPAASLRGIRAGGEVAVLAPRAAAARRCARDPPGRRRHELRDARARAAAARLRPRQARRAHRGALREAPASRSCCSTARTSICARTCS